MSTSNFKFQVIYEINIQVIVFTVLAFSQQILKLGLKIMSFSKSTVPVLLKNVRTFNPRLLEGLRIGGELSKPKTPENPKTNIFKTIVILF